MIKYIYLMDLKETILFSNSLNESEYLKTLAKFDNPTFGLRILNTPQLAEYALKRNGKIMPGKYVKSEELAFYVYKKIKEIDYFKNYKYLDIVALIKSINDLRLFIVDDEENELSEKLKTKRFLRKNRAIFSAYLFIQDLLKNNNMYDAIDLIRFAISVSKPIENVKFQVEESETKSIKPLEKKLLEVLSNNNINVVKNEEKPLKISSYSKAFGQTNEIENILQYIYKNNIPFDECLVASASVNEYAKILINYKDILNLPISIGTNFSINETYAKKFLDAINEFMFGHSHKDYLFNLIKSPFFNLCLFKSDLGLVQNNTEEYYENLNKQLGTDKLSYFDRITEDLIFDQISNFQFNFDPDENDKKVTNYEAYLLDKLSEKPAEPQYIRDFEILKYIKKFTEIFNKGLFNFIERYHLLNEDNQMFEEVAYDQMIEVLKFGSVYELDYAEICDAINNINVGSELSRPGRLHITSIEKAKSCLRKHLFITGLSSNNFPGKPVENPNILDQDYEQFGYLKASEKAVEEKKDAYFELLDFASRCNADIHLSYTYYNSTTLKNQSGSSVIFETYRKENGIDKSLEDLNKEFKNNKNKFKTVSYFETDVLYSNVIGRLYNQNTFINLKEQNKEQKSFNIDDLVPRGGFSASALVNYMKCPYMFYLANILGLEQQKDTNEYELIPANELGTIAHSLLENRDPSMPLDEFKKLARSAFLEYFISHPIGSEAKINKAADDFEDMMENAFNMEIESIGTPALKEKNIVCTHKESGIRIHGFPDKVEKLPDGRYRVIDYKTGKPDNYKTGDAQTLLQGIVYAYLIKEKYNFDVESLEFWFIRYNSVIKNDPGKASMSTCYETLTKILKSLRTSLETGTFTPNEKHCANCYWHNCAKRKK